jgi:hypothetical protein
MTEAVATTPAATPSPSPAAATTDTALTAAPAPAPAAAPGAAAPAAAPAAADPAPTQGTAPEGEGQKPALRAPAEYTEFTEPEGQQMPANVAQLVKETAKELDLTQDQAQKLVELNIKRDQLMHERVNAESTRWLNELPSDKEFGGEKLSENLAIAKKAIDTFGTPELKKILEQSRLGNHPEFIRAFYRAGKAISQDNRLVAGGSGNTPAKGDAAAALYPNQKPA